jgi:hypothetical protein
MKAILIKVLFAKPYVRLLCTMLFFSHRTAEFRSERLRCDMDATIFAQNEFDAHLFFVSVLCALIIEIGKM